LIRKVFEKGPEGEWRSGIVSGTLEIGAESGFRVLTSPRFGLETERSGRAGNRTDSHKVSDGELKVQARNIDLAMVAQASL
jgi:hypothetical protein